MLGRVGGINGQSSDVVGAKTLRKVSKQAQTMKKSRINQTKHRSEAPVPPVPAGLIKASLSS